MRRFVLIAAILLLAGCGNKMDLPVETEKGEIPFDGYYVYASWGNVGVVTDILVTQNQWIYLAEDSATVTRYKRKGANENGTIVARAITVLDGLEKPLFVDEGMEDHLFILDIGESPAEVKLYDLFVEAFTVSWSDASWALEDSTWKLPGRDSATVKRFQRDVDLTALAADLEDNVLVAGRDFSFMTTVRRHFDTTFVEGTSQIDSLTVIGADTSYSDSAETWFVRKYDVDGDFLLEAVGDGTGLGYGREIADLAVASDRLFYVDGATERVKLNDPGAPAAGIDWLTGLEITDAAESFEYLLDPGGLAIDPLGNLYVSDSGNGRVLKYNSSLRYTERVDQNAMDLMTEPTAVAAADSLVYVYDRGGAGVVLFELPKAPE